MGAGPSTEVDISDEVRNYLQSHGVTSDEEIYKYTKKQGAFGPMVTDTDVGILNTIKKRLEAENFTLTEHWVITSVGTSVIICGNERSYTCRASVCCSASVTNRRRTGAVCEVMYSGITEEVFDSKYSDSIRDDGISDDGIKRYTSIDEFIEEIKNIRRDCGYETPGSYVTPARN